ncbi:hypothetical protein ACFXP3_25205 [Streptomyces sp. NPDC059096]
MRQRGGGKNPSRRAPACTPAMSGVHAVPAVHTGHEGGTTRVRDARG